MRDVLFGGNYVFLLDLSDLTFTFLVAKDWLHHTNSTFIGCLWFHVLLTTWVVWLWTRIYL